MIDSDAMQNLIDALRTPVADLADAQVIDHPAGRGRKVVVVQNDYSVKELAGPTKNARKHTFHDVVSFADYVKRVGDPGKAEILVGEHGITAALDPESPNQDLIACQLAKHPSWEEWSGLFGSPQAQRRLYGFLRTHQDTFPKTGDDTVSLAVGLMTGLAKLKVSQNEESEAELDERGFYRVQSESRGVELGSNIPSMIQIETPVFRGVEHIGGEGEAEVRGEAKYLVDLLVELELSPGRVSVALSCPNKRMVEYRARQDAVAFLQTLLATGDADHEFKVGLGDAVFEVVDAA